MATMTIGSALVASLCATCGSGAASRTMSSGASQSGCACAANGVASMAAMAKRVAARETNLL